MEVKVSRTKRVGSIRDLLLNSGLNVQIKKADKNLWRVIQELHAKGESYRIFNDSDKIESKPFQIPIWDITEIFTNPLCIVEIDGAEAIIYKL